MENEPDPFHSTDDVVRDSTYLRAYSECWDGKRMKPSNYIDLFKAEHDPFLDGLEGCYGESQVDRRSPLVPPIPRQQDTQASVPDPPVGES